MLKNLKIGKKLVAAFIAVTVLASIAGVISIWVSKDVDTRYSSLLETHGFVQGDVADALAIFCRVDGNVHDAISYQNEADRNLAVANVQKQSASMVTLLDAVAAGVTEPELVTKINDARTAWQGYEEKANELVQKSSASGATGVAAIQKQLVAELDPFYETIYNSLNDILDAKVTAGHEMSADLSKFANNASLVSIAVVVVSFIVSIALGVFVAKGISRPITACAERLEKLATGDLKTPVPVITNQDETGILANATKTIVDGLTMVVNDLVYILESMADGNFNVRTKAEQFYVGDFTALLITAREINIKLSDTLAQINQAAEQVSSGAEQVSIGAQALSQGATEQASSVEELAATIGDISGQVKDNASSAKEASSIVDNTGNELTQSNEKMQHLIAAMDEISKSSQEIGKVIKTIEDIAFQTNILALNAAVEAARAGTAGKGFAVVADEVRSLASKSSEAAKGTTALIENSIRAVENGTNLADETAKSLLSVVEGAAQVATTVNQIAVSSDSQATSIMQVTMGVDQISSVVQTNSATAEESAAASEELSGQAQILKDLVGRFELRETSAGASAFLPTKTRTETPQASRYEHNYSADKYSSDKY